MLSFSDNNAGWRCYAQASTTRIAANMTAWLTLIPCSAILGGVIASWEGSQSTCKVHERSKSLQCLVIVLAVKLCVWNANCVRKEFPCKWLHLNDATGNASFMPFIHNLLVDVCC